METRCATAGGRPPSGPVTKVTTHKPLKKERVSRAPNLDTRTGLVSVLALELILKRGGLGEAPASSRGARRHRRKRARAGSSTRSR